jgi:Zn-finger protein
LWPRKSSFISVSEGVTWVDSHDRDVLRQARQSSPTDSCQVLGRHRQDSLKCLIRGTKDCNVCLCPLYLIPPAGQNQWDCLFEGRMYASCACMSQIDCAAGRRAFSILGAAHPDAVGNIHRRKGIDALRWKKSTVFI